MLAEPEDNDVQLWTRGHSRQIWLTIFLIFAPFVFMYFMWVDPVDWIMSTYLQLSTGTVVILAIYLFLLLVMWPLLYAMGSLYMYPDRVVRAPRFRPSQTFYLRDLIGWEPNTDHENGGIIDIRMYFSIDGAERRVVIGSSSHLKELSDLLTERGYPHHHSSRHFASDGTALGAGMGLVFVFIVLCCLIVHYGPALRDRHKGTEHIILSHLVTTATPYTDHPQTGPDMTTFHTQLSEDITFYSYNDSIAYFYSDAPAAYNAANDTVSLQIFKYDYDVKIAHTLEPTFFDKHFGYGMIHIASVHFDQVRFRDYALTTDPHWPE